MAFGFLPRSGSHFQKCLQPLPLLWGGSRAAGPVEDRLARMPGRCKSMGDSDGRNRRRFSSSVQRSSGKGHGDVEPSAPLNADSELPATLKHISPFK
jgi:hypothetical protein